MAKTINQPGGAVSPPILKRAAAGDVGLQISDEMIRLRAYQIYLARNGAPGDPNQDWAQAEQELRGKAKRP